LPAPGGLPPPPMTNPPVHTGPWPYRSVNAHAALAFS
jgi:hypothetical protein